MKNKNYEPILELAEIVLNRCRADLERPLVKGSQGYISNKKAQVDALRLLRPLCGKASVCDASDLEDEVIRLLSHFVRETKSDFEIVAELSK